MISPNKGPKSGGNTEIGIRDMQARFESTCRHLEPLRAITPDSTVFLGCSAGGDSMALMDLAACYARTAGWNLEILHFDHAQREESSDEAEFVLRACEALGLPCRIERMAGDPHGAHADEGRLREARYGFFARNLKRAAGVLLLAHHADDQAETLLMRLMRGSGPTGLGGIRPVETIAGMTVVRPLLEFRRRELRDYLELRGRPWSEDPSNADDRFKRAWVRNELLPLMNARMEMDLAPRLQRAASLIQEEASALNAACRLILRDLNRPVKAPALAALTLDHPSWEESGPELRRALLRHWIWSIRQDVHPPGFEAVQEILKFIEKPAPRGVGRLRTVERIHLAREGGALVAYPDTGS